MTSPDTTMKGIELARAFFDATRDQLFSDRFAPLADHMAAGLVGEGSECLGYDDLQSRDHDWGPGYCIWLDRDDYLKEGAALQARYSELTSKPFLGFAPRDRTSENLGQRRVGVFPVDGFYELFLRSNGFPTTLEQWRRIPDYALATATNGQVFEDTSARFTRIRTRLLEYYPEDIRLRKIAQGCMLAAQAGQYNFPRQARREEKLAELSCLEHYSEAVMQIAYALERRYMPFYKWAPRGLLDLGETGKTIRHQLDETLEIWRRGEVKGAVESIEGTCTYICGKLAAEGLSNSRDTFLVAQAIQVNSHISDDAYRATDLMSV